VIDPRLRRIFATVLDPDAANAITLESTTETVPGWDSHTYVDILLAMEDEFGVAFSTLEAARMNSLRSICQILADKGVTLHQ
jgi:acyl carrier protein